MRAWQIEGAFGLENLRQVERPDPEPGPGEVRIRLAAASLNYRDLMMVRGEYNPRQPLPLVPLSDGVGVIDGLGAGVGESLRGVRVAGMFAPNWTSGPVQAVSLKGTIGGPRDGMAATHVVLPATAVAPVPEHLDDIEAATLPCAALTAWSALVTQGGIAAGQTVLVQGTGGVSSFALEFAHMHGAAVIATTSTAERVAFLEQRGAVEVVNYVKEPKWGARVRELTGGRGVDLVVEVGGSGTLSQSLRAVRPGGVVSLIGVLSGGAAAIDLTPALMNNVRIQGVFVGSHSSFVAMTRALELHRSRPLVDRVFGFDELPAAFRHLQSRAHRGKVCMSVS